MGGAPVLDPTDEGELEIELSATTPVLYSTETEIIRPPYLPVICMHTTGSPIARHIRPHRKKLTGLGKNNFGHVEDLGGMKEIYCQTLTGFLHMLLRSEGATYSKKDVERLVDVVGKEIDNIIRKTKIQKEWRNAEKHDS